MFFHYNQRESKHSFVFSKTNTIMNIYYVNIHMSLRIVLKALCPGTVSSA